MCFTFMSQTSGQPDCDYQVNNDVIFRDYMTNLISIYIKLKQVNMLISIHKRGHVIGNTFKQRYTKLIMQPNPDNKTNTHFLQVNKITVKSLPKPYESDCVDRNPYDSLINCIDNCKFD